MKASMASLVGSRISACGSNGLPSGNASASGGFSLRHLDIALAGRIQRVGVPPQRLRLVDRALRR